MNNRKPFCRTHTPRLIFAALALSLPTSAGALPDPPEEAKPALKWATLPFSEGFEDVSSPEELISETRWGYLQITPQGSTNYMEIAEDLVHSGSKALHMFAESGAPNPRIPGSTPTASKSALHKTGTYAFQTETLEVSAWFYFAGAPDLRNIFLFDFECAYTCNHNGVGPRVMLTGSGGGYPVIEFGQMDPARQISHEIPSALPTIRQSEYRVPTNEWFHLRWLMVFGVGPLGQTQLYLNGRKIIDATRSTSWLPAVDRVKVGLTANSSALPVDLYVDDILIQNYE